MSTVLPQPSFLATRRGKLTLALLCAVAFLDFVDASIVNVALPSIRHALHFSVQGLQWVPSGAGAGRSLNPMCARFSRPAWATTPRRCIAAQGHRQVVATSTSRPRLRHRDLREAGAS
jgi:MFS family permease